MKTNSSALTSADPIRSFLQTLPKEAKILGAKCYHGLGKVSIYVCYCFDGKRINTSFSWEGGAL
jgi:hypothetical protein